MEWLRIVQACRVAQRSQNVLYRLGVTGRVRTRRGLDGRLEFLEEDLMRIARSPDQTTKARSPDRKGVLKQQAPR